MSDEKKVIESWDAEAVKLRKFFALRDLPAGELLEAYTDGVSRVGDEQQSIPDEILALGQEILRRMRFAP